jgi:hypothetical protein
MLSLFEVTMSISRLSSFAVPVLGILFFQAQTLHAATAASCTFTYFNTPSPYNLSVQPNGINNYGTVVGQASSQKKWVGFIRYPNGQISLFSAPNSSGTFLNRKNDAGTSVGYYNVGTGPAPAQAGFILTKSSSFATVKFPHAVSTFLYDINKYNTIVGTYQRADGKFRGLIYKNGTLTSVNYPGAYSTYITANNNNGAILGAYITTSFENPPHGFILYKGVFKASKPGSDLNNWGTIVAGNTITYKDGTTKTVHAPGSYQTFLYGIDDKGVVTGNASYPSASGYTWKNFTAQCK